MATLVKLRELTAAERAELERLARSRTEEARLVVRAKIVLGLAAGERPYQVADRVGVGRAAAYEWLHRFNAEGLKGLTDHARPGRPPTYTPDQRAEVIAAALTRPDTLGLPFASWTLDRLQAYLAEHMVDARYNSRVCDIVNRLNVRFMLTNDRPWGNIWDGLTYPRPSRLPGFELVDEGGTFDLYRVTACDPDPADPGT